MTYELLPKDFNPDAKTTNRDIARLAAEGDTFSADAVSPDPRSGWVD